MEMTKPNIFNSIEDWYGEADFYQDLYPQSALEKVKIPEEPTEADLKEIYEACGCDQQPAYYGTQQHTVLKAMVYGLVIEQKKYSNKEDKYCRSVLDKTEFRSDTNHKSLYKACLDSKVWYLNLLAVVGLTFCMQQIADETAVDSDANHETVISAFKETDNLRILNYCIKFFGQLSRSDRGKKKLGDGKIVEELGKKNWSEFEQDTLSQLFVLGKNLYVPDQEEDYLASGIVGKLINRCFHQVKPIFDEAKKDNDRLGEVNLQYNEQELTRALISILDKIQFKVKTLEINDQRLLKWALNGVVQNMGDQFDAEIVTILGITDKLADTEIFP